jgi:hypothetical protein
MEENMIHDASFIFATRTLSALPSTGADPGSNRVMFFQPTPAAWAMSRPRLPPGLFRAALSLLTEYHSFVPSVSLISYERVPPQAIENNAALVGYPPPREDKEIL